MTVGKVATHLYLTLIVKELKTSVEQSRLVTTLYLIKQSISLFSVVFEGEACDVTQQRLVILVCGRRSG